MDKSENTDAGSKPGDAADKSMKERLLAQRRADAAKAGPPPVPAAKPAMRPAMGPATPANQPPGSPPARSAASAARPQAAPAAARPALVETDIKRPLKLQSQRADEFEQKTRTRRESKTINPEVQREVEMLRKRQDKWITYGWIVAGGLLAIAGIVLLVVMNKKGTIDREAKEYEDRINSLVARLDKLDVKTEVGANEGLKLGEETKGEWTTTWIPGVKADFTNKIAQATSSLDHLKEVRELADGLKLVKAAVQNAANMKPEELAQVRRNLLQYETKGSEIGPEFMADVADAKQKVNHVYAERLHEEAKAAAARGPSEARAALVIYTKAEDEIASLLDEAVQKK